MSTLSDRVAKAAHFVVIPSSAVFKATPDCQAQTIWDCLKTLGVFDDEVSLSILENDCKEGDARAVFCDKFDIPVPRFRRIWSILKGSSVEGDDKLPDAGLKAVVDAIRPIGQYTDEELVAKYGPQCDSAVEEELRKRSKGRNCMCFDKTDVDTYVLNADASVILLKEARRRDVPQSYHHKDKVYRVYPVGEFPEQVYLLCPLDGKPLFNGYCDTCGIHWVAQKDVMVFISLMVKAGIKLDVVSIAGIQTKNLDELKKLYPKVAEVYDDLESIGELPSLKTKGSLKRQGKQDPFASARF